MLTYHGIGIYTPLNAAKGIRARAKRQKEAQALLLANEEKFEAACDWMASLKKSEKINYKHSSYWLKHIAEQTIGMGHLANGTLIAAALYCGFDFEQSKQPHNLVFNIDQDSLQAAYDESREFDKYALCEAV